MFIIRYNSPIILRYNEIDYSLVHRAGYYERLRVIVFGE